MTCKWMSDDGQDICCNGDCSYAADFCPYIMCGADAQKLCIYAEFKKDKEVSDEQRRSNQHNYESCGQALKWN